MSRAFGSGPPPSYPHIILIYGIRPNLLVDNPLALILGDCWEHWNKADLSK